MAVERCICHEVPLHEVVRRAQSGQTFQQISTETGCCTGCGMCEAYVHVAMATGQTQLPLLSPVQVEKVLAVARANGLCASREPVKRSQSK